MDKKKKIIIGSLCGVLLLMVVGYAAFSSLLNINGTSTISSNWEVKITNIVSKNIVGTASNVSDPTFDDLSATFKTNLVSPGDSIEYDVTVSNSGNVNAKLDKITLTDSKNDAIKFSTSGLTEGDGLNAGDSAVLTVKVAYDESVTSQPNNLSSTLTVKLDYSQNTGNSGGSVSGGGSSYIDAYGTSIAVVTEGDGLYADEYESGRYIYKGANPNNYITFNDETWRIMSVENDGTIKIMRGESVGNKNFDSKGLRTTGYCANGYSEYGCNAWGIMTNFAIGSYSGSVDADASLNTYLNGEYYNSLTSESKALIVNHDFSVGFVEYYNSDLDGQIESENTYKWNGKVGLMTVSEVIRSNTNTDMCGNHSLSVSNYSTCKSTNYIYSIVNSSGSLWTISPFVDCVDGVFTASSGGSAHTRAAEGSSGVAPALYLTSDITLVGDGTSSNPYVIE